MTTSASTAAPGVPPRPGRRLRHKDTERGLSRVFRWLSTGAGVLLLLTLAAVAVFLLARGWAALSLYKMQEDA